MRRPVFAALLLAGLLPAGGGALAEAMKVAATGCSAPADAERIAALQARHDRAGAEALGRPLVAARSCLDLAKGRTVDIDERRPPLACVRLPGDLSCYWVAMAAIDEHPGDKGGEKGGGRQGGRRH